MSFSATAATLKAYEADLGYKLPETSKLSRAAGKASLYGGRSENYFCGDTRQAGIPGQLFLFDFTAQYARLMASQEFPDFTNHFVSRTPQADRYVAEVDVEVDEALEHPPLPYHVPEKNPRDSRLRGLEEGTMIFPVGRWSGTYVDTDLNYPGVKVLKYKRVINFPSAGFSFAGFIERFVPKGDNPVAKAIRKNIYTSFSGKFAQGNKRTMIIKNDPDKLKPEDYRKGVFFGDYVIVERMVPYPRSSNYLWTSYTNSFGRFNQIELFNAIKQTTGIVRSICHANTDSAMAWLPTLRHAKKVLEFFPDNTLKSSRLDWVKMLAPKCYIIKKHDGPIEVTAGGIPRKLHGDISEEGDEVFAEIPDTFFEALRRGAVEKEIKNTWTRKKFTFSQERKLGRIVLKDGWTKPIKLPFKGY